MCDIIICLSQTKIITLVLLQVSYTKPIQDYFKLENNKNFNVSKGALLNRIKTISRLLQDNFKINLRLCQGCIKVTLRPSNSLIATSRPIKYSSKHAKAPLTIPYYFDTISKFL